MLRYVAEEDCTMDYAVVFVRHREIEALQQTRRRALKDVLCY